MVAIAGPNGAGKSTFYRAFLARAGFHFINADVLAREMDLDPYEAARIAGELREALVKRRKSFVFETVFSDPVGDKVNFMKGAAEEGYTLSLCFIGVDSPETSEERVAMRVSQGGHDVPTEKLISRFSRTMANLKKGLLDLPLVHVYDNTNLREPFRHVVTTSDGKVLFQADRFPAWLAPLLPGS